MKKRPAEEEFHGYGFGTFQGVFTPSILTIIGAVLYLRFGWMLGHVGLTTSLLIVTMGSLITFLTGLSISSLATNMKLKGGGAYFILSRSLGLEAGAALGIPLALSQVISVSFYIAGFTEALIAAQIPYLSTLDPRVIGLVTLTILAGISTLSADIALKTQYFIMAAIIASLASFFLGGTPANVDALRPVTIPPSLGFWTVFAVFFPAVTGILSGLGMSGDLKNPARSIPVGTLGAVLVGYLVYMSVPIVLHLFVSDVGILRSDMMILQQCARWGWLILVGVWAATLSSAIGSFLCAPRVFQALARDRVLPRGLGCGYGENDDPRLASLACFGIAAVGIWLGDINIIAPVLTLFNLSTYGLLNLAAAGEELMSNPSWRPTFRVKFIFSFVGFVGCLAAMFMISPGWTIVALVCEGFIYWLIKRRALRARWGDMRTGLMMAGVRFFFQKLATHAVTERNWRPNLIVFSKLPALTQLLKFARDLSDRRSLVTLASVIPEAAWTPQRQNELQDSLKRTAERLSLDAVIKMTSAKNEWLGMTNLVRAYGFGPIVPNTILMGMPSLGHEAAFSKFMRLLVSARRNVILVGGTEDLLAHGYIDIWWRGAQANGGFMLALAFLLQRNEHWKNYPLRFNTIVPAHLRAEAQKTLSAFLSQARIEAETRIIVADDMPFTDAIVAYSADAAVTFMGLRQPREDETPTAYGEYLNQLRKGLKPLAYPIFTLAAEDVNFRRIFT